MAQRCSTQCASSVAADALSPSARGRVPTRLRWASMRHVLFCDSMFVGTARDCQRADPCQRRNRTLPLTCVVLQTYRGRRENTPSVHAAQVFPHAGTRRVEGSHKWEIDEFQKASSTVCVFFFHCNRSAIRLLDVHFVSVIRHYSPKLCKQPHVRARASQTSRESYIS